MTIKTTVCLDSWTNQNAWMNIEVFTENKLKATNGYRDAYCFYRNVILIIPILIITVMS